MKDKDIERFWSWVVKGEGCWQWQGATNGYGYGVFRVDKKNMVASRFAWEVTKGKIPFGFFVCHTCDNPGCVNLDHLFLGTQAHNMADAKTKGRLHIGPISDAHRLHTRQAAMKRQRITDAQVVELRQLYAGGAAQRELAEKFSISPGLVNMIGRGERRSDCGGPITLERDSDTRSDNIAKALTGKKLSAEHREKLRLAKLGKPAKISDEARARKNAAIKAAWAKRKVNK